MHQMMNDVEKNLETLQRMMHFSFAQSVFEIIDVFIHLYDFGNLKFVNKYFFNSEDLEMNSNSNLQHITKL